MKTNSEIKREKFIKMLDDAIKKIKLSHPNTVSASSLMVRFYFNK